MLQDSRMAYSEINEILKLLEAEYVNRIPQKVINFFEEERNKEYKPTIRVEIPLDEQKLKRETMVILAILNLNYWCDSEDEKEEFKKEFVINEKERKILEEKYNPENLFKSKQNKVIENDEKREENITSLIEYKKTGIIKKILEKITRLFKHNRS